MAKSQHGRATEQQQSQSRLEFFGPQDKALQQENLKLNCGSTSERLLFLHKSFNIPGLCWLGKAIITIIVILQSISESINKLLMVAVLCVYTNIHCIVHFK